VNAIASRLKELLAQIAIEIKVEIIEMEIMSDHVHLLVEVDPQFGIHRVVKRFKGVTSRYLRLEFPPTKT
jgi:putative transposase